MANEKCLKCHLVRQSAVPGAEPHQRLPPKAEPIFQSPKHAHIQTSKIHVHTCIDTLTHLHKHTEHTACRYRLVITHLMCLEPSFRMGLKCELRGGQSLSWYPDQTAQTDWLTESSTSKRYLWCRLCNFITAGSFQLNVFTWRWLSWFMFDFTDKAGKLWLFHFLKHELLYLKHVMKTRWLSVKDFNGLWCWNAEWQHFFSTFFGTFP